MKTSLKENLKNYITSYKPRAELRAYGNSLKFDLATSDRKLRELTNEGKIKPTFKERYIIGYEPRVYSPELSHTSPVGALSGVEPIYITKRREEVARRANNPQKQLL